MKNNILYYPNIEINNAEWLKKAVLYWDEVTSIVPSVLTYSVLENNQILNELHSSGNYRTIEPGILFNSELFFDFETEVIRKIKYFLRIKGNKNNGHIRNYVHKEKMSKSNSIHVEKMNSNIIDFLNSNNLIERHGDWFLVDEKISETYMATLAKYIALEDENNTVIGTDNTRSINKVYPRNFSNRNTLQKDAIQVANITLDILPVPSSNVSIRNIVNYKRTHGDELLAFRIQLSEFEQSLSNAETFEEYQSILNRFDLRLKNSVSDIQKSMKSMKVDFLTSSLDCLVNLKTPKYFVAGSGVINEQTVNLPMGYFATVAAATFGIEVAVNYLKINKTTREHLNNSGFLYIYKGQKKGILNDFL